MATVFLQPYLTHTVSVGNKELNVYTLTREEVVTFIDQYPDYAVIHTGEVDGFFIFSYVALPEDINPDTGRQYGMRLYRNIHIGKIENEEEITKHLGWSKRTLVNDYLS